MLRSIAAALAAPVARNTVHAARPYVSLPPSTLGSFSRSFGTSARKSNDRDSPLTPAPTPQPPQQQPQAEASPDANVKLADVEVEPSDPDAMASSNENAKVKQTSASSLDDILGAVSAVALPGTEAESTEEDGAFRSTTRQPAPRRPSRYSSQAASAANSHKLHVRSSRNNTILTLTSPTGEPLVAASGGSVGFKHAQRSGYEAGYRAAFAVFDKVNKFKDAWRIMHIEIFWNGFGQGREAVFRALLSEGGHTTKTLISRMTDKTPIKVGGVRPKKRRML